MTGLARAARSAVIWNTGFNVFRDVLHFGTMVVLVRILEPERYGEFAMVTSIIGFLSTFSHANFIAHVLQVNGDAETRYQDHFSASGALQIAMFMVANIVGFALANVAAYAAIAPYLHAMSVTFLLDWPCELRRKMLERAFDWKRLRMLQATGLIAGAVLAVGLAICGAGTYSLLIPGLLVAIPFIYDLYVVERWRPTWAWSWSAYRPAWRFGIRRMGSGIAVTGRQLLESSVLTWVVGLSALGVYGRAMGLAQLLCAKFASQLIYAIYPILARVEVSGAGGGRVGGLVLRLVAWIAVPTAVVCAELAKPIVLVIYGSGWEGVIPLLPVAMGWGALSAIGAAAYALLLARHRPNLCMLSDAALLVGTLIALGAVLPLGLRAYLAVICLVQAAVVAFQVLWLLRMHGVSGAGLKDAFIPPIVASVAAWALLWPLKADGRADEWYRMLVDAFVWGAVFSAAYLAMLRLAFPNQVLELVRYVPASERIEKLLRLRSVR